MKKRSLQKRILYWFDRMMSKGTIAMIVLLAAITAVIVGTIGVVAYFVSDDGGILFQLWSSLLYTLDAGNLAGVPTDNIIYLILMSLSTLCGLFLTSVLVGIIATGVEDKLTNLRKGKSVVQEDDHTVIIGFDNNIYDILRELIDANSNKKRAYIVVLGETPKDEMEDAIASHIQNTKTTRIICRSGKLYESHSLELCSVETAKSVIINANDDPETIKILLALAAYIKNKDLKNKNIRFIASLQNDQYIEAANIAGEGRSAIIYAKDAIARIISNTCRQHGLSQVLTELFNFSGNEMYFENVPELEGKTFKEATLSFSNAIAIGLYSNGTTKLNPPMNTIVNKEDQIILIELDDGGFKYHPAKNFDSSSICISLSEDAKANDNLVILGSNDKLPIILKEYSKYVHRRSQIVIFDDDIDEAALGTYDNLEIIIKPESVTIDSLRACLNKTSNNVLLLNDDSQDPESSDSQTLLRLILLRNIADQSNLHFSITTEMRNASNQRLASQARVDDFVIGSNFASLIKAQISENPQMLSLIDDLLDEDGSELYMKPASNYVKLGVPVDSYTLTESASQKNEIYIGYRLNNQTSGEVVVNPQKDSLITFGEYDQIIVISEK